MSYSIAWICLLFVHAVSIDFSRERLERKLQQVIDKHSVFWNASFSFAIHNDTVEAAVASGHNDYADPESFLTTNLSIPMGSTTKMYSAVGVLRLVANGTITLDQKVAPLVDRYLAQKLPCGEAPSYCKDTCVPIADCMTRRPNQPSHCSNVTRDAASTCSYCYRYLHCFCDDTQCPKHVTLRMLWDNTDTIEEVTFRELISMTSGVEDYYFDTTNWLMHKVFEKPARDVEPLEYLTHMPKPFLFKPGSGRASYSTNGFSLVGLALAGLFNLTDWKDLDQRDLAWGKEVFSDDQTLFPTQGTCLKHPRIAHQYTSWSPKEDYIDMTDTSCINSWMGGNLAARPLDVARFTEKVFTKKLITEEAFRNMTTLHEVTDGFAAHYLAYGMGLEAMWNGGHPTPSLQCGFHWLGHAGQDYGSGAPLNGYFPALKLGVSFAMTSANIYAGNSGMNCSLSRGALGTAGSAPLHELLNTVMEEVVGIKPTCPTLPLEPLSDTDCKDAHRVGSIHGLPVSCGLFFDALHVATLGKFTTTAACSFMSENTLAGMKEQLKALPLFSYEPPAGYDANTTIAVDLCRHTCGLTGAGPCWLSGATEPWGMCAIGDAKRLETFVI